MPNSFELANNSVASEQAIARQKTFLACLKMAGRNLQTQFVWLYSHGEQRAINKVLIWTLM